MPNPEVPLHRRGISGSDSRRRHWFRIGLCAALLLLFAGPAWAGSYLNRAALLISQASHEAEYVRTRLGDKELAHVVHAVAEARVEAAGHMEVPKEVAFAHPHLLLTLENYERAMAAAEAGEITRFLVYLRQARDEEFVFRSVLKRLGWSLPDG